MRNEKWEIKTVLSVYCLVSPGVPSIEASWHGIPFSYPFRHLHKLANCLKIQVTAALQDVIVAAASGEHKLLSHSP